jgi:hypothetical protein
MASMPRPPAFETAAASSGVAASPIGAWTTGTLKPQRTQNGVTNDGAFIHPDCNGEVGSRQRIRVACTVELSRSSAAAQTGGTGPPPGR